MDCFQVETPTATYVYGKRGAGFASIIDKDGRDWVSYRPGGEARGEYRGLPKCGQPTKYFHCGYGYGQYQTDNPFSSRVTVRKPPRGSSPRPATASRPACGIFSPTTRRSRSCGSTCRPSGSCTRERRGASSTLTRLRDSRRRTENGAQPALVEGCPLGMLWHGRNSRRVCLRQSSGPRARRGGLLCRVAVAKGQSGSFQDMTVFGFGRKGHDKLIQHVADLSRVPRGTASRSSIEPIMPRPRRSASGVRRRSLNVAVRAPSPR